MSIDCACYCVVARDAEPKISKSGKTYLRFTGRVGDGDAALWLNVMAFVGNTDELTLKLVKGTRVCAQQRFPFG